MENFEEVSSLIYNFTSQFHSKFYIGCQPNELKSHNTEYFCHYISTEIASYFAILREKAIRIWNVYEKSESDIGSETTPFDLSNFGVTEKAFFNVCKLLSPHPQSIVKLTKAEVKECDRVVEVLRLDKFRYLYFHRSREGDTTHGSYKISIE